MSGGGGGGGGGGAFHRGAKSPLVLLDRSVNSAVYILWDTLVPFSRQHLGNTFYYQDDTMLRLIVPG